TIVPTLKIIVILVHPVCSGRDPIRLIDRQAPHDLDGHHGIKRFRCGRPQNTIWAGTVLRENRSRPYSSRKHGRGIRDRIDDRFDSFGKAWHYPVLITSSMVICNASGSVICNVGQTDSYRPPHLVSTYRP